MSEAQLIQTDSLSHQRNANRVAQDEAELQELLKKAGIQQEDETQEEQQTAEAESDSEEPSREPVQAEDITEQETERKAETQEADDKPLTKEEQSFKKRYGDLRRHVQEKEQEWKIKFEKLEQQLNAATKNELVLPKSEQDIEAWAKKYPDVAGIVEAIADKKAQERAADLDGRLKEIEALRIQAKRDRAEAELLQLHPDFEQIRSDDAFHDWAEDQPKWVQDALYENAEDAKSVARVIDLYKADTGTVAKPSNNDRNAAASVRTKRNTSPNHDDSSNYLSESQVAKMSIKEYEKRQDEIMEAQRKGKFIYDMSKK
jgi:hypothetical protein